MAGWAVTGAPDGAGTSTAGMARVRTRPARSYTVQPWIRILRPYFDFFPRSLTVAARIFWKGGNRAAPTEPPLQTSSLRYNHLNRSIVNPTSVLPAKACGLTKVKRIWLQG
jgi:hypothetical protein